MLCYERLSPKSKGRIWYRVILYAFPKENFAMMPLRIFKLNFIPCKVLSFLWEFLPIFQDWNRLKYKFWPKNHLLLTPEWRKTVGEKLMNVLHAWSGPQVHNSFHQLSQKIVHYQPNHFPLVWFFCSSVRILVWTSSLRLSNLPFLDRTSCWPESQMICFRMSATGLEFRPTFSESFKTNQYDKD